VARLISNFKGERVTEPSYIVMNRGTLNMFKSFGGDITIGSSYETLYGFPIAVSEILKFGEIEII